MEERTEGLILRCRLLTESSLIVTWLTRDAGRIATVAKGARRPKSPFRGKLDLFYTADFSFQRSRRSDLHTLREVDLRVTHPALRRDLNYLQQASYGAALIEQTVELEAAVPEIYSLFLEWLERIPSLPRGGLAFELKLLRDLGLKPDLAKSGLLPGSREIVEHLTEGDWDRLGRLTLSPGQAGEIGQFLHGFLIYHLGKIPKGRQSILVS